MPTGCNSGKKPQPQNKPSNEPTFKSLTSLHHVHIKTLTFILKNSVKSSWSKILHNSHLLTTLDWMHLSCLASFPLYMTLKWITNDMVHFTVWHLCHCNIFPIQYHMTVTNRPIFTLKNPTDVLFWASSLKEGFSYYFCSLDLSMQKNLLGYLQHNPSCIPKHRCLNMNIHLKKVCCDLKLGQCLASCSAC